MGPYYLRFSTRSYYAMTVRTGIDLGLLLAGRRDSQVIRQSPTNLVLNVTTNFRGQVTGATLNPGFLETPDPGTLGNFPRNEITGPSFTQWDFSLTKRTKFFERGDFEFKVTFYHAFNQANFVFGDITAFDSANFGRISTQRGSPRVIHFILGINF